MGLAWLLFLILLCFQILTIKRRNQISEFEGILVGSLLFWVIWWIGSQQSRWLYPVLVMGWIGTLPTQKQVRSHILILTLIFSAGLSCLSQMRAYAPYFFSNRYEIQKAEESKIRYADDGQTLMNIEMLYVSKPAQKHGPASIQWVIPNE